ncbi:MAG: C1 family peptidase [Clostridiales bacterium]|nr:C1 family peptidase [Clostridiales bacterium]
MVLKSAKPVSDELLGSFKKSYESDTAALRTQIFASNAIQKLSLDPVPAREMKFKFSNDIKTMTATNQKSSGRCWLFAATNVLREVIGKKKNIAEFELSQSYLAFWDKFERCNYFLESVIDTADLPITDRTVSFILQTRVNDGGQWDMFTNIVRKYGIVPKDAMPETFQSSNTHGLSGVISPYLLKSALALRRAADGGASEEELQAIKNKALDELFVFLTECYSLPPEKFNFEYVDKDDKYHIEKGYTPITFRDEMIGNMLDDYVSIINAPTTNKPYEKLYTVRYLGNVVGGAPVLHLNLPMDKFKEAVVSQIKDGEPVWFGSDCGKCGESTTRIWDDASVNTSRAVGLDITMSKADALDSGYSMMNHAMVLTGVNLEDDTVPTRWKVENSWGSEGVNGGYYIASDSWFDLFVYQAVVNKKYLGELAKLYETEPVELDPWDPIGSLAD